MISESGNRFRFADKKSAGNYVDIICSPDGLKGRGGSGTVHHIVFSTTDAKSQMEVRDQINRRMLKPTRVLDRQYFCSIYFTEPGGVLFEVATADDLFTKDEVKEHLGELLKLPEWLEKNREKNEKSVTPVVLKT